jgi:hypothetical protein
VLQGWNPVLRVLGTGQCGLLSAFWSRDAGLVSRTAEVIETAARSDRSSVIIWLLVAGDKEARRDVRGENRSSQTLGASRAQG